MQNDLLCDMELNLSDQPMDFLINGTIATLSYEQKVQLKNSISKCRPKLSLSQKEGRFNRTFQQSWYSLYTWLTGYSKKNSLHCFYCLMFGGKEEWTKTGITGISNFRNKAAKHSKSIAHITNAETFHLLGKSNIKYSVSEGARMQAIKHNENVSANRRIIGRLIDVICLLGRQELAFRGHRENADSSNKGNYLEVLDFLAMEEPFMSEHFLSSSSLKGTSNHIQNDLIEAVSSVVRNKITTEINEAEFISIQADDTTDVSVKSQLSIIVRYCLKNRVEERFIGFFNVSAEKTAKSVANVILEVIEKLGIQSKLVCQTYDGATLMSGKHGGVQKLVRDQCPNAIFIHCYAHQLNLVLLHGANSITEVKLFICDLTGFHSFFNRSSRRMKLLEERGFKLPQTCPTRWNFHSGAVSTIKKHYDDLLKAIECIANDEQNEWDPSSINAAIGLKNKFKFTQFFISSLLV